MKSDIGALYREFIFRTIFFVGYYIYCVKICMGLGRLIKRACFSLPDIPVCKSFKFNLFSSVEFSRFLFIFFFGQC